MHVADDVINGDTRIAVSFTLRGLDDSIYIYEPKTFESYAVNIDDKIGCSSLREITILLWGTLVYILGNIGCTYWRTLVYILGNISVHIGNIGVYDQHAHCYLKLWGSSENQL